MALTPDPFILLQTLLLASQVDGQLKAYFSCKLASVSRFSC